MKVSDLRRRLAEIEEKHPDAEIRIDPPYSEVRAVYYREEEDIVELSH